MNAEQRRKEILELLKLDIKPISANKLAEKFDVSRQIIVGDIALLRAAGENITATPRGYVLEKTPNENGAELPGDTYVIATNHDKSNLADELYIIVDNGGTVVNVSIEHPLYGTISQNLKIRSRYDADKFLTEIATSSAPLLCELTKGVHLHTLICPDPDAYKRILIELKKRGILHMQ